MLKFSDSFAQIPNKDWIDLSKISVKEYLGMLKIDSTKYSSDKTYLILLSDKTSANWIEKSDVEWLMKYVDSKEPSYCVMQVFSSHLPINETSKLGGQVMNLIDSYRLKKEYPFFLTDCSKNDEKRSEEIKEWWKTNKSKL